MGSCIEIQQRDRLNGHWANVELSKVRTKFQELVVGRTFRILVDGKEIHREEP